MRRALIILGTALVLLIGCGGDDGNDAPSGSIPASIGDDVTETTEAAVLPYCTDLVGMPTGDAIEFEECRDGESTVAVATESQDCTDGRTLYWNDQGWGYSGEVLQPHARPDGQPLPPQAELDACSG